MQYNQAFVVASGLVAPAEPANRAAVEALATWMNDPERQAVFTERTLYGPVNSEVFDYLPEDVAAGLINSPSSTPSGAPRTTAFCSTRTPPGSPDSAMRWSALPADRPPTTEYRQLTRYQHDLSTHEGAPMSLTSRPRRLALALTGLTGLTGCSDDDSPSSVASKLMSRRLPVLMPA